MYFDFCRSSYQGVSILSNQIFVMFVLCGHRNVYHMTTLGYWTEANVHGKCMCVASKWNIVIGNQT